MKTKKFSYDGRSRIPTETYKKEYNRIFNPTLTKNMPKTPKKSKYRNVVIKNKKYFFYKRVWVDITGDSAHATAEEFNKFDASIMVTQAYLFSKDKKTIRTFASYELGDELFSDRNVFPKGCIIKMEKIVI